jgi:hypothetical protein
MTQSTVESIADNNVASYPITSVGYCYIVVYVIVYADGVLTGAAKCDFEYWSTRRRLVGRDGIRVWRRRSTW